MADQKKIKFVNVLQAKIGPLAEMRDALTVLQNVYLDRGYNGGGADPITEQDIEGSGLTLAEVNEIAALLVDINKFFSNQAVATEDRDLVLSKYREDV